MSFSKIPFPATKLRCYRCGRTTEVRKVGNMEWCRKCRAAIVALGVSHPDLTKP